MLMTVERRVSNWVSPFVFFVSCDRINEDGKRVKEFNLLIISVIISRIVATTFKYKRSSVCARHLTTQKKNIHNR